MSDNWISVDNRLPEKGKRVYVFRGSGVELVKRCNPRLFCQAGITHWQPATVLQPPPPPKPVRPAEEVECIGVYEKDYQANYANVSPRVARRELFLAGWLAALKWKEGK